MNAIRLIAALLVLGLGGCANYPMGSLKTDLLPAEDVAASYSLNTAWWKGYHDADLDRIVALALERNVDLALSAIKVNRALYQARLLSADLVPSFSANASAAASHNIDNGNAARSYQTEFGVSYEVDLWQKLRNAANAQEWEYKATMEDREAARLALVNSVADTYFELKYLDESIKVMDASVKRYQELLRLIEAKYEFGKVASVEPLQAQQSLLSARNSLLDLQDRQNVARQTLRDLLNIRPGENPAIGNADPDVLPHGRGGSRRTRGGPLRASGHPGLGSPPAKRLQDAGVGPRKLVPDDLHRLDARHLILNLKQGL